jgi:hypothetical protein
MQLFRPILSAALIALAACGTKSDEAAEPPPPPTVAITVQSTPFVIQPGEEVFKCFYTTLPIDAEAPVARFESNMSKGSHHLILFGLEKATVPDGTLGDCRLRSGGARAVPVPLYVAQEEHQETAFPRGIAMPLKAKQPVAIQMHYLNPTAAPITVQVEIKIHALEAGTPFEPAGIFASFHDDIAVPPRGTQTVKGRCRAPEGVKFLSLTTHSHRYTTRAVVGRAFAAGDREPETLVETLDYERPTVTRFERPFLDLASDEIFYSCEYDNPTDQMVSVGDSAVNEEMCMAVGYYYPSTQLTFCLGSTSLTF